MALFSYCKQSEMGASQVADSEWPVDILVNELLQMLLACIETVQLETQAVVAGCLN